MAEQSPSSGLPSPHAEHSAVLDAAKARAVPQAVLSEAEEPHQYLHRPSDVLPQELNASDASDDARPDAVADDCPSGRRPDLPADVDVGKSVGRELDVHLADAYPGDWLPEPLVAAAPDTLGADRFAEQ